MRSGYILSQHISHIAELAIKGWACEVLIPHLCIIFSARSGHSIGLLKVLSISQDCALKAKYVRITDTDEAVKFLHTTGLT